MGPEVGGSSPILKWNFFTCSQQEGLHVARGDTEAVEGPGFPLFQAFIRHNCGKPCQGFQNLISNKKTYKYIHPVAIIHNHTCIAQHCVCPHLMSTAMRGTLRLSPRTILLCRIWNPLHSPNRLIMSSSQPYIHVHTEEVEGANNCVGC